MSDEILAHPGALPPIRTVLSQLVSELGAHSAFLVDETGTPFAAFGHVEFPLPHPLSSLSGWETGTPLLAALLGETTENVDSNLLVQRVSRRVLLTVVLEQPLARRRRHAALKRVKRKSAELAPLLKERSIR